MRERLAAAFQRWWRRNICDADPTTEFDGSDRFDVFPEDDWMAVADSVQRVRDGFTQEALAEAHLALWTSVCGCGEPECVAVTQRITDRIVAEACWLLPTVECE